MPTHYDDRRRRDTPAQDQQARRAQQNRTSALSMARGRDTPAQDTNLRRQQTPAQGRAVSRQRVDRERTRAADIGRQQRFDDSLLGRGISAIRGMLPRPGPGDTQGMRENFTPDDTGPDQLTPFLRNVGGFAQETVDEQGLGRLAMARPQQLGAAQRFMGNQMDRLGLIPEWAGGGQAQDGRGQNTPGRRDSAAPQLNQTALEMARGVGGGQGYATGPDGRTQFFEGTQRNQGPGNLSVMGSGGGGIAAERFAEANRIRQEMIDSQRPQNQVTVIPDSGAQRGGVNQQIERLVRDAGSTRDPWQRAAINRQISQLQQVADRGAEQQAGTQDREAQRQLQQMRNQGAMATTLAGQQGGADPYDMARAEQIMQETRQGQNPLAAERPTLDIDTLSAIDMLPENVRGPAMQQYMQQIDAQTAQADLNDYLQLNRIDFADAAESWQAGEIDPASELGMMMSRVYGGETPVDDTEDFAGGGLVPEMSALSFAQGGMVPDQYAQQMGPGMDPGTAMGMAAPGAGGVDMMQVEYDQYAQGAQQMGVPAIPFEEFVGLKQQSIPQAPGAPGAQQPMTGAMQSSVQGFAQGGMVPGQDQSDTSGKMIVDPNPNAPQDSIPAVIDGQRPAKLDSGEFVIPKHVVMWHGIDKLNKLIAQAEEKGQGNGTESGSTAAGQSATGAAGRSPTA